MYDVGYANPNYIKNNTYCFVFIKREGFSQVWVFKCRGGAGEKD